MKVYTKTGDSGQTSLIGGKRVSKANLRVNAYGTLDEINAFVGVAVEWLEENEVLAKELKHIQQKLFDCGTDLANPDPTVTYLISKEDVEWLEEKIDVHAKLLPPFKYFVLPGGSKGASYLHLARTVVRRGEREIIKLSLEEEMNQEVLQWVNRLSDYFFVTARLVNVMLGVDDVFYQTK
jgi:cob(I)alamin adenosyltransferase